MFPCEDSKTVSVCPSVCPHPEKRYHQSFVNISPTLMIDTSMERSSRVLHHGNPKIWIFFQKSLKFEFWLLTKSWNHLRFVNISPTLVIDTSMERSSQVLHHGIPKIWFFNEINEIEFCPYPEFPYAENQNRPGFVNISPTLLIDMSMERSSRVLQHGNKKFDFFSRKFEIEFDLYFDLCWRAEIIQVGLNMHLYVDIGMHRRPFEGRHLVIISTPFCRRIVDKNCYYSTVSYRTALYNPPEEKTPTSDVICTTNINMLFVLSWLWFFHDFDLICLHISLFINCDL